MSVSTLIGDAGTYAGNILSDSTAALASAESSVGAIGFVIPTFTPVPLPDAPPALLDTTLPTLTSFTLDLPEIPSDAVTFQDIPALEIGEIPRLEADAPTITLPTTPAQLAGFYEVAPALDTDLDFPEPPSTLLNPTLPELVIADREEPDRPQVTLPSFDAIAPTEIPTTPTNYEERFTAAYRDAAPSTIAMLDGQVDAMLTQYNPRYAEQMAAIESQLATYMAGGTGLNAAAETAIYERSKSKTSAEARRLQDANWVDAAARGFTIPTGALMAGNSRARQAGADLNAQAARDIVVLQAEMEQKNLQFSVTTSTNLRQTMLSAALAYHQNLIQINGQAIEYAKTTLSAIIEVYNTAVKAFGLKLDSYRTEAQVYDTRLKAATASIELYKQEIQALEALTQVDKLKVDTYKARVDVLNSLSNVYRAQIEAVQGRANLEKLKMELFQVKVQAYGAQVQAKNSEWQGYTAAIEGQTAKTRVFASQVDAYRADVDGYGTEATAKAKVIEAAAMTNRARADQYTATVNGFKAVVDARGEEARVVLENQRQVIVAFQAQMNAAVANAGVQSDFYKATASTGIANAELQMKAMLAEADSRRAYGASIAQLASANAAAAAQTASAALAGMNTLASESTSS